MRMNLIAQPVAKTAKPASANRTTPRAGSNQRRPAPTAARGRRRKTTPGKRRRFPACGSARRRFQAHRGSATRSRSEEARARPAQRPSALQRRGQLGQECRQHQVEAAAFGKAGGHDQGDHTAVAPGRNAFGLLKDHALAEQEDEPDQRRRCERDPIAGPQCRKRERDNTPATQASRDIQERCGWRSTYMKRHGRPILNIKSPRPQAMMASAASAGHRYAGFRAKLAIAATPSKPAPAPPQRKLPEAFQSQCF